MATATKKMNIFKILFASGYDVEDYSDYVLPKELADVHKALGVKENEVKKGFNSSKGGVVKKVNLAELNKKVEPMREKHDEVVAKNNKQEKKTVEYEIGD